MQQKKNDPIPLPTPGCNFNCYMGTLKDSQQVDTTRT
jgi:hypothetical protein